MTTLQESILIGDCDDVGLRGHVKTCQTLVGREWTEGEAQDMWARVAHVLHLWRGTAEPFTSPFRGVDTTNDVQLLSRLVQLRRPPIGDWSSAAIEKILALGVLKSAVDGDMQGALLLLVDLKTKQQIAMSEKELADNQKMVDLLTHQADKLLEMAPDFKRGRKIVESARKGHENTHGNKSEKEKLNAKFQASVNELHEQHPHWSWTQISDEAGKLYGRSGRSIRDNTVNPIETANNRRR